MAIVYALKKHAPIWLYYFKDKFYHLSHINKCLRNKEKNNLRAAEWGSLNNLTDRISHQQELNTFFSIVMLLDP